MHLPSGAQEVGGSLGNFWSAGQGAQWGGEVMVWYYSGLRHPGPTHGYFLRILQDHTWHSLGDPRVLLGNVQGLGDNRDLNPD